MDDIVLIWMFGIFCGFVGILSLLSIYEHCIYDHDIEYGIKVCEQNEHIKYIKYNNLSHNIVYCRNGAVFKIKPSKKE
jgi:hypothetical protein